MQVKITVSGPNGQNVEEVVEVQAEGELGTAIGKVNAEYKRTYPDAPLFERTIKVDKA